MGKTPLNLDFSLDLPLPVCYFSPSEQGVHQADLAEGDEFKKMKNSDGEVLEYIYIEHINVHGDGRGEAGEEKQASGAITEPLKC